MPAIWASSLDVSQTKARDVFNISSLPPATLMRSSDPAREFADMAGKALSIEWMVDNAPNVFQDSQDI